MAILFNFKGRRAFFGVFFLILAQAQAYAGTNLSDTQYSDKDYPKVQTADDEELATRFSWWPTDSKPAPVKDANRSGYWWWPDEPGQARPWGNQGYVYVRKIIFDYRTADGEQKPSLVIKRVITNVKAYFDYDKADLRDDARAILSKALYTMRHNPEADILITGNTDQRGSEDYNQGLGEHRAAAVKDYMISNGIENKRVRLLSRGKLDALAPTNDIVGMQKDRNAQFVIAEVEEVMIPASQKELYESVKTATVIEATPEKTVIEKKETLEGEIKVNTKDYVIQPGDSLWKIATKEYGDGQQWKRLYQFNKDVISNPDRPKKGTKINIPIE